jgi:hypothetical protein
MRFKKPLLGSHQLKIFLFFLLLIPFISNGQSYNRTSNFQRHWLFNINGGTSLFFGDIKQYRIAPVSNNENEWRFGGGTMLGMQISPIFGVRGQFLYGKLAGTRREWNVFFESNYLEFNLNTTIGLRNIFKPYSNKQFWNAYVLLGIGLTNYNTEVKDLQTKQVIKTVGYGNGSGIGGRTLEGLLMGGLGIDLRLNNRLHLNLESANRILNSDMLDGRVSGFKYDVYNYTSVGLSYNFGGNRTHAPKAKEKDYKYFSDDSNTKKKKNNQEIEPVDYDYDMTKPVSPPEVDILTITPVIVEEPVEPVEETVEIVEVPVEPEPVAPVISPQTSSEKELEYRVQIIAKYGKKMSKQYLSNLYNIPASDIKENTHNGYYIYTVGSFDTYDQAREKRNIIRTRNGVSDAFVVAFRNGVRLNKLP